MQRLTLSTVVCVLAMGPLVAGGPPGEPLTFTETRWGSGEPFLAVNPDGSGILLVNRTAGGRDDLQLAALRAAEIRNPGLLRSFAEGLFGDWADRGIVERNPEDGSLRISDQASLDQLNARLRVEVALALQPYLDEVRRTLPPNRLTDLAWSPYPDASLRDHVDIVAPIRSPWYTAAPMAAGDLDHVTTCVACADPDGSTYCPGQCVSGCDPDGTNCTSILVGDATSNGERVQSALRPVP